MAEKKSIKFKILVRDGAAVYVKRQFSDNELMDDAPRKTAHVMATQGVHFVTQVRSHVVVAPATIERIVWFDSEQDEDAVESVKASLASGRSQ